MSRLPFALFLSMLSVSILVADARLQEFDDSNEDFVIAVGEKAKPLELGQEEVYKTIAALEQGKGVHFKHVRILENFSYSGELKGDFYFINSEFAGNTDFENVTFSRCTTFDSASFSGNADFMSASFSGLTTFNSASFSGNADFIGASFSGLTTFNSASFSGNARFRGATFAGKTFLDSASFSRNADFIGASFSGLTTFNSASFSGNADFIGASFSRLTTFNSASFSGNADFESASFAGKTLFSEVTFHKKILFEGVIFEGKTTFAESYFFRKTVFSNCQFNSYTDFSNCHYPNLDKGKMHFLGVTGLSNVLINWRKKWDFKNDEINKVVFKYKEGLKGHLEYDEVFYLALIKNFQELGLWADADDVYFEYREEERIRKTGWKRYSEYWLLKLPFGYGTKPFYLFNTIFFFIVIFGFYYVCFLRHWTKHTFLWQQQSTGKEKLYGIMWGMLHSLNNLIPEIDFKTLTDPFLTNILKSRYVFPEKSYWIINVQRFQNVLGWYFLVLFLIMFSKIWIR